MTLYTIVAILPDNTRYQVAVDVSDEQVEKVLDVLKTKHVYRYARFEIFTEEDDNEYE